MSEKGEIERDEIAKVMMEWWDVKCDWMLYNWRCNGNRRTTDKDREGKAKML